MHKMIRRAALALLGVAVLGAAAAAQQVGNGASTNTVGTKQAGIYWPDTTGRVQSMTTEGYKYVTEAFPSANNYQLLPMVISGVFASVQDAQSVAGTYQNRDSTSAIDCRGYNRAALLMYPTGVSAANSDSLVGIEFALQVRAHPGTASDSSVTFRVPTSTLHASGGATRDSVGSLFDVAGFSAVASDSLFKTVMPDEIVVTVGALFSGASSKVTNRGMVVWTGKSGSFGSASLFPFTSWRLRATKQYYNSSGNPTAMPSGTVAKVNVRCDLVLWRE